jgi:hypothetical protein
MPSLSTIVVLFAGYCTHVQHIDMLCAYDVHVVHVPIGSILRLVVMECML